MKYMGSKNRIAKYIIPIMVKDRLPNQYFIDAFCGGCNLIDKVDGLRMANDNHYYLIQMWKMIQLGYNPDGFISKEKYYHIKNNMRDYLPETIGYVGFNCSYSGKWFGGYAGIVNTKEGVRNYQEEAYKNIMRQSHLIKDVVFNNNHFSNLEPPPNSIIYCDIPYKGTTQYHNKFDHELFYDWAREQNRQGNKIFVSEYEMPPDFNCIWEMELSSSLSANGKSGANKKSIERLFTL